MAIESLSTDSSPTAEALLLELGRQGASGVLEVSHPGDDTSHAWFRGGRVYAMQVPGYRPALGIRLLSGGLVSPEQLSAAAAQQRERFPTHLIGQVLVGMGFVSQDVIDAFIREQVLDQVADLLDLPIEDAKFHAGRRIQQDVIAPTDVAELLEVARERRAHRSDVLAAVGGPSVVPALGPPGTGPAQTPLGPYDWALLCRVDGSRDLTELARVCGFTVQEAAQIVSDLALTGLLTIPQRPPAAEEPLAPVLALHPEARQEPLEPEWEFASAAVGDPEPVGDLLAEFSAFVHDGPIPEPGEDAADADPGEVPVHDLQALADEVATLVPTEPVAAAAAEPGSGGDVAALTVHDLPDPTDMADPADAELRLAPPAAEEVVDAAPTTGTPPTSSEPHASASPFPPGAPVAPSAGYSDTSVFMRELSSLSDDPEPEAPVVTRLVVPITEQPRKRRFWGR